ncbi:MAG: cell division protein ZapA [Paracoccus sp. (in: a-proteobacteria)]|nr:cell division protein ZapA [Paracoccus sp. (in: a-proteobacteria)]
MADVNFRIGHKDYSLQAQDGEEKLLRRAAGMLNAEAEKIIAQAGRMPEPRLLLLAGLMLADRVSSLEDRAEAAEREAQRLRSNSAPISVVPEDLEDAMAELAARAEALADRAEEVLER